MANPTDFLLNTDYEMDKIVFFIEGKLDNWEEKEIPHNLGFAPLVFGVCSYNEDFSDSRTIPYTWVRQHETVYFGMRSYSDKIYIQFQSDENPPHDKVYYRIYGFEPTTVNKPIGSTSKDADKFVLNTDYNYCKLYKKGIIEGNNTVDHNLGYIPQVLIWEEPAENCILPIEYSSPEDPWVGYVRYLAVTDKSITSYGYPKIHYRIYYDEG